MDEKFSLQDIANLLAEQTGSAPANSEKFIQELVELINKGIREDGIVKIKGFGTFKIVVVKERESVHVNTGERIVIPAHHKLSFKPDDDLKELINKPFSIFETIEAPDENLKNMPTPSEPEIKTEAKEEVTIKMEVPEETPPVAPIIIKEEPVIEKNSETISSDEAKENADIVPPIKTPIIQKTEDVSVSKQKEELISSPAEDIPITKITSDEETETPWLTNKITEKEKEEVKPTPVQPVSKPKSKSKSSRHRKKKSKKSSMTPLYIILVLLLCILAGCIWYYFSYSRTFDSFSKNYTTRISGDSFALPGDSAAEQQAQDKAKIGEDTTLATGSNPEAGPTTQPASETSGSNNQSTAVVPTATTPPATTTDTPVLGSSNKILAKLTIEPGDRLTLLASKYYSNKIFWVYIYEYNKDKIGPNPDNVRTGMEILIPAKDVYGIDANSAESRDKARKLQTELVNGKK